MSEPWTRYLAYGKETTYGTAAAMTQRVDILGESLRLNSDRDDILPERLGSVERVSQGFRSVGGSVDLLPDWTKIGHWLGLMMGAPSTETLGGGGEQHTWIHVPGRAAPSWTVETYPDVRIHRWLGVIGKSLRMATESAKHFAIRADLLGADEVGGGSIPSLADSAFNAPLAFASSGDLTFALALEANSVSIEAHGQLNLEWMWNRGLRLSERLSTPQGSLEATEVEVGGSLRWFYNDDTEARHDAFLNLEKIGLTATWTGPTIPTTSDAYELRVEIPNAYIPRASGPNTRPGGRFDLTHSMEFRGRYDTSLGSPFRIRLTNGDSDPLSL